MDIGRLAENILRSAMSGQFKGILAVVLPLLGLAALGSLVLQIRIGFWPTVVGQLIVAEAEKAGTDGVQSEGRFVGAAEYRYTVAGQEYTGTKLSLWEIVASSNYKRVLELQLPMAASDPNSVNVIYNPREPGEGYLKRPSLGGKLFTALFAGAMLAVPFLLF